MSWGRRSLIPFLLTAEVEVHVVVLLRVKVLSHVHDAAAGVVEHAEVQYTAGSAQLLVFVLAEGCSRSESRRILPNRLVPRYVF